MSYAINLFYSTIVIPAEAGIQCISKKFPFWIPTFVGMTIADIIMQESIVE
ncbi:MAG: hypothetical protein L0958_05395 [Candidatus Mariimomonas ferrooxydans]